MTFDKNSGEELSSPLFFYLERLLELVLLAAGAALLTLELGVAERLKPELLLDGLEKLLDLVAGAALSIRAGAE